jgi:tetratricopeptide (TPR) repeat protein
MMGTINYMSPEQVRGERADHRADIFSTAVVLYELLSGRRAFEGESFAATMYKILEVAPQPLLEIDSSLPLDVVQIVEKALAKPRDERYQQVGDMLRDLSAYRMELTAMDSPAIMRRAVTEARLASQMPTIQTPASPMPIAIESPGSGPPASGSVAPAGNRSSRLVLAGAAAVLAIVAAVVWTIGRQRPPAVVAPPPTPIAATEPPISDLMQKALSAFAAEDYTGAVQNARAVLVRDPGHTAALQLLDRARAAATAVTDGVKKAQALFDEGKYEEASRAAGAVLSVAPGNADAKRIMEEGTARSRGRGAEEARAQVARAKAAARSAGAQRLAATAYAAATAAERDAEQLFRSARPGDATVKFYEASGLYRSAEVAAQNEASTREALARSTPPTAEKAAAPPQPEPARPQETAPPSQPQTAPPPPVERPPAVTTPVSPPASPLPLPTAPPPAPAPAPSAPAAEPPARTPNPEAEVTDLLARYKSALEGRDISALKRIWPSLSGIPESRLRSEFDHASQISAEILDSRTALSGNTGTVTFLRRYLVVTTDGQRLRSDTRATMDVRRTGSAWVIEGMRFEPVR